MNNKLATQLAASLAHFFLSFIASAISIALPAISREFQADAILLGWLVTLPMLAVGVCLVPFGRLSDMVGIKKIFLYGMIIYTISSAISVFSVSSQMLLLLRILQGIGVAMVVGNTMALITSVFPAEERGRALGINAATVYVGMSAGPFLGGLLTEHFGWRSIFLINVPAGLIVIWFTLWKIKGDWSQKKGEKFDLIGSIIYGLAIILIMYGFTTLPSLSGAILIAAGILGVWALIKWEGRMASPILDIGLFRNNRAYAFSNLAALLSYAATAAVIFYMSLYLQYIKGLTPDIAGLIMLPKSIIQAIVAPLSGRLSDKMEPRIVSSIGMTLSSLGLFLLFGFLNADTPLMQIVVFLVILGLGFAMFISPNVNAIMSSVKPGVYGIAAATLGTMRTMGMIFSMGITMLLFAIYMGPVMITPEYYPAFMTSIRTASAVFAVLCLAGIFASLARGNVRATETQKQTTSLPTNQENKKEN